MRKSTKIVGVLMVAGIVAAAGSAATGNGFTSNAGATQFIGGTVSTTVTGATLSSIAFTTDTGDPSGRTLSSALLTFADANTDTKTPTIASTTTSGGTAGTWSCTAIEATHHTSTCTASGVVSIDTFDITIA